MVNDSADGSPAGAVASVGHSAGPFGSHIADGSPSGAVASVENARGHVLYALLRPLPVLWLKLFP